MAMKLAQVLMDSVGPRLTGSPGQKAAHDWAVKTYASWGIDAKNEPYGTWTGWRRGTAHVDMIAPRVRTLMAVTPAWGGSTKGPVEGDVALLPEATNAAAFEAWLPQAKGKFILTVPALVSCRPDSDYEQYGQQGALERMDSAQDRANAAFNRARVQGTGMNIGAMRARLAQAGVAGILQSSWRGDGTMAVSSTTVRDVPTVDLYCEDYGLLYRLAENRQGPKLRVNIDGQFLQDAPTFNTIATVKGSTLPNEYVMLSAHFDSWDGGSGATDNGTGTVVMMEAMRILKQAYPNPKRTIIAGHWSGEEQGLHGSHAWEHDHPEVTEGMMALFNQDNGTGRVVNIGMQGLPGAAPFFARWMNKLPQEITQHINLNIPGTPSGGGTDNASFICDGAPAFGLGSISWNYGTETHHTNRDTFDKVVPEEVINNATLTAMLVYLASEETSRIPRDTRVMPMGRGGRGGAPAQGGQRMEWPSCRDGARTPPGR
jgi:hypothetical protein